MYSQQGFFIVLGYQDVESLQKTVLVSLQKFLKSITLHNWLISMQNRGITHGYIDNNSPDKPIGDGILPLQTQKGLDSNKASEMREIIKNFVNGEGLGNGTKFKFFFLRQIVNSNYIKLLSVVYNT